MLKNNQHLTDKLEESKSQITIGASYRHYKNHELLYVVKSLGFLEVNEELCVIYQAQYGDKLTFIRPLSVWLETVTWHGKQVPRFSKA